MGLKIFGRSTWTLEKEINATARILAFSVGWGISGPLSHDLTAVAKAVATAVARHVARAITEPLQPGTARIR